MNEEQQAKLFQLIWAYGRAMENLGGCQGSFGWNALYCESEAAADELRNHIKSMSNERSTEEESQSTDRT